MKNGFLKFVKKYGFNSIVVKNSISMFFVFMLILTILISALGNFKLKSIQKEIKNNSAFFASKTVDSVETTFREMEYLCSELLFNEYIGMFFTSYDFDHMKENFAPILSNIIKVNNTRRNTDSVYVYSETLNTVCTHNQFVPIEEFEDKSWLKEYKNMGNSPYKMVTRKMDNKYVYAFTFIKKYPIGKGAIIVNINLSDLRKNCIDISNNKEARFYMIDDDKIIYSNDISNFNADIKTNPFLNEILNQKSGIKNSNRTTFTYNVIASQYYSWKYVYISPYASHEKMVRNIYFEITAIMIIALLISGFVSFFFSLRSSKEVVVLLDILEHENEVVPYLKENEISDIVNRVIRIIDNNNTLKEELQKRISDYENIKIKVLQSQFNTHFMNNSLATINGKVIDAEGYNSEASQMIVKLSKILKYSFIVDETFVTLKEELDFVNKYIEILELRYGKINNLIHIPDELKEFKIPRMCLQILVENAVFHNKGNKNCMIEIDCKKEKNGVTISVYDNGYGMSEETIAKCRNSFESDEFKNENIGLTNIYRRLKLIYGEKVDLVIESKKNEYTKISIVVKD